MDQTLQIVLSIAALNVALIAWLRVDLGRRIDDLRREFESRCDKIDTRFDRVDNELRDLRGRTARIEGILERPPHRTSPDPDDHQAAA